MGKRPSGSAPHHRLTLAEFPCLTSFPNSHEHLQSRVTHYGLRGRSSQRLVFVDKFYWKTATSILASPRAELSGWDRPPKPKMSTHIALDTKFVDFCPTAERLTTSVASPDSRNGLETETGEKETGTFVEGQ